MEKRGKTHRGWKRRYFVLIEDDLWYYKDKTSYEKGKDPIASIQLTKPAAIIKIVIDGENTRKNTSTSASATIGSPSIHSIDAASIIDQVTNGYNSLNLNPTSFGTYRSAKKQSSNFYYFDIHTPKRIFNFKVDDYDTMLEWISKLQRPNIPNSILNSLDSFMADSEYMHGMDDEKTLDSFNNLDSILTNEDARRYYRNYLHTNYIDEFIDFWDALTDYLSNFHSSSQSKQLQMAQNIFNEFIARGAKRELSEIRNRDRNNIQKKLETGYVTKELFGDIQSSVYNHLNADFGKFFNSIEYYKFVVTYKQNAITSHELNNNKYQWPPNYKETYVDAEKITLAPKIHIPSAVSGKKNVHSPVYLGRSYAATAGTINMGGTGMTGATSLQHPATVAGVQGLVNSGTSVGSLSPTFQAQTYGSAATAAVLQTSPHLGPSAVPSKSKKSLAALFLFLFLFLFCLDWIWFGFLDCLCVVLNIING